MKTIQDCPEEEKSSKTITSKESTNSTTKEDSLEHTEEESYGNRFQDMETESANRMTRCNPAPGAGEMPSPGQTTAATPTPTFRAGMEQSATNFIK